MILSRAFALAFAFCAVAVSAAAVTDPATDVAPVAIEAPSDDKAPSADFAAAYATSDDTRVKDDAKGATPGHCGSHISDEDLKTIEAEIASKVAAQKGNGTDSERAGVIDVFWHVSPCCLRRRLDKLANLNAIRWLPTVTFHRKGTSSKRL
jgi:hypothetical protein